MVLVDQQGRAQWLSPDISAAHFNNNNEKLQASLIFPAPAPSASLPTVKVSSSRASETFVRQDRQELADAREDSGYEIPIDPLLLSDSGLSWYSG